MNFLNHIFAGNTILAWIQSLCLTTLVLFLFRLLKTFVYKRINAYAQIAETTIDDLFSNLIKKTNKYFVVILSIYVGTGVLELNPKIEIWTSRIAIIVLVLQFALWGNILINSLILNTLQRKKDVDASASSAFGVLAFFARIALWSILVLIILDNLDFNISPLIASLGVGGVAVALATQKILGDVFCSLAILLDKPFVVGDFIVVDDHWGTVEYIGVKTTRLRSLQGQQIVIANADLLDSRIQNFKRMTERRVPFNIGITYQTPCEKVEKVPSIIQEIIDKNEQARFDRAHFQKYGDFALIFEAVYFVKTGDYKVFMDTQQSINLALFKRFAEEGIEFAYPTQTLHVNKIPKESDRITG